jgi:ferredoxin
MTYVICEPCIGVKDRACVDECPVDCIYEGPDQLYIHPEECVDCDACLPACPVDAIFPGVEGVHREEFPVLRPEPCCFRRGVRESLRAFRGARRIGQHVQLSNANLGERISILFRIADDEEHPFSEVTGVLLRVEDRPGPGRRLHVMRRSGEVVEVEESAVVKLKLIPAGSTPFRTPPSWRKQA